jgi:hypothetical protein
MTPLTILARPEEGARLRPLPWRRMAWVTWRQHRAGLAGVAALLGALAAYLLITGLRMHHAYAAVTACHPASSAACQGVANSFSEQWHSKQSISALLQVVPALAGAFTGAPVLARELETGTFRYAWTQGFGRGRWATAKLTLLAAAVTAAALAFSLLFSWYYQPFLTAGGQTPFDPRVFDLRGMAFAAWTLAAFALGAFAGMLFRRVVPALAAALAAWTALALATALWLRQHYMTPLVTSNPSIDAPNWLLNSWDTAPGGKPASQSAINQILQANGLGPNGTSQADPVQVLARHGITQWWSYQPVNRFWPFQWIEGGWLLALSVLLIAATIWLVRRRAA